MARSEPVDDGDTRRRSAVGAVIRAGVEAYRRERMLPRLLPLGPEAIADTSPAGRRRVVALLARALRGERQRGRAGHWSYSLDRHIGLAQAMAAERIGLIEALRAKGGRRIGDEAERGSHRPRPGATANATEASAAGNRTATADRNPRWP